MERIQTARITASLEVLGAASLACLHMLKLRSDVLTTSLTSSMRDPADGKVKPNLNGHIVREQLMAAGNKEEEARVFNAGGHGTFARPTEYTRIIAMLLVSILHTQACETIRET